jgi:hypothetical protein
MKYMGYCLMILGPAMMVYARPFTDKTNLLLLTMGGIVGMIGLFMRRQVKPDPGAAQGERGEERSEK